MTDIAVPVFGDVVRVSFPYAGKDGHKERPAVVINSPVYQQQRADVLVLALSSRLTPQKALGEAVLLDWEKAGLTKPSRFKAVVATVMQNRLLGIMGRLSERDIRQLRLLLSMIIGA